jgi:acyl carrier protein
MAGRKMMEKGALLQISQSIRSFIFNNYLYGYDETEHVFENDSSFLEFGVLDSLGIFELIAFIEKEFCIEIKEADILPENFDSIDGVSRLVNMKVCNAGVVRVESV